jgi:hypothetical protein
MMSDELKALLKKGNDMPRGWRQEALWHDKVYRMWRSMWSRVYNHLNYFGSLIEPRYSSLSEYAKDIQKLENFDLFKENPQGWSIDKDNKIKGNRDYYFEALSLVPRKENSKERMSRKGSPNKNHFKPIIGINIDSNFIIVFKSRNDAKDKGFDLGNITKCCQKKIKSYKGYKWEYLDMNDRVKGC